MSEERGGYLVRVSYACKAGAACTALTRQPNHLHEAERLFDTYGQATGRVVAAMNRTDIVVRSATIEKIEEDTW